MRSVSVFSVVKISTEQLHKRVRDALLYLLVIAEYYAQMKGKLNDKMAEKHTALHETTSLQNEVLLLNFTFILLG